MTNRGLVEKGRLFAKGVGEGKGRRGWRRGVLLVGAASLMLWGSPIAAKPSMPAMPLKVPLAASPHVAISSITLLLENDNANGAVFGGLATGSGGFGVVGFASATTSANFGVAGATNSETGTGVFGLTFATTCPNVTPPVSLGQTCVGVVGQSLATSGTTAGVAGLTQSSNGAGVVGEATSSTCCGTGVVGLSTSGGNGVEGQSTATSGGGNGVEGTSASASGGAGVFGQNTATSGMAWGVMGVANSPSGAGIQGIGNNGALAGSFAGPVNLNGVVNINCPTAPCLIVGGTPVAIPDLAEDMPVTRPVSPGDVVVLTRGQGYGVAPATQAYDTLVAGIVSTSPRMVFGIGRRKAVPVAMVGVVNAKATAVNGAIKFGDLLTTSPVAGRLMRCEAAPRCIGAIVGKALEPLPKGEHTILVLLWRQ